MLVLLVAAVVAAATTTIATGVSGVAHGAYDDDISALRGMRELLEFLPLNNKEAPPVRLTQDNRERADESLRYLGLYDINTLSSIV